jgi:hypothetical protein
MFIACDYGDIKSKHCIFVSLLKAQTRNHRRQLNCIYIPIMNKKRVSRHPFLSYPATPRIGDGRGVNLAIVQCTLMFFQRSAQSWKQPFFACYLTGKDPGNQCDQRQNTWWMNPTAPLSITVGDVFFFVFSLLLRIAFFQSRFPALWCGLCVCLLDFPFSFFFAGHVIPERELAARQLWFGHENKYAYRIRQLVWFRHRALATTPWRVSLQYVSSTSSANELRTCKCRRRSAGTELKT